MLKTFNKCLPQRQAFSASALCYDVAVRSATSDMRSRAQANISRVDAERAFSPSLVDSFKRRHDYLRVSLTEKCNLRCFYCMPRDGVELSPSQNILTNDEIVRLVTLFVEGGVTKVRLTGGEPTVRKGLAEIILRLRELRRHGLEAIAMTSNGIALHRRLPQLIENGLTHLNLSLDTLDPLKFQLMTRRMGHDAVLRTLDVALESPGLTSVKLNAVVVRGLNDSELFDFLELTKDRSLAVRFIEFMPFAGTSWSKEKMVPSSELLSRISARHPGVLRVLDEANNTARSWRIPGYRGTFAFISSMSDDFCATCNRLRITADGKIKVCLFDSKEVSLRDAMRLGASDDQLLQIINHAVQGKQEKHPPMEEIDTAANRPMILIGAPSGLRQRPSHTIESMWNKRSRMRLWPTSARHLSSSTASQPPRLTHLDEAGRPSMVDVSEKESSRRSATASGRICIPRVAYELVTSADTSSSDRDHNSHIEKAKAKVRSKGNVLSIAQLAGIMGCKRTSDLVPLCHPLLLTRIDVVLSPEMSVDNSANTLYSILCRAQVSCMGSTGVEMEALTAVSTSLLTVWDMLKAVAGKEMLIGDIKVDSKAGGRTGDFTRQS